MGLTELLLVAKTDTKVYAFAAGTLTGTYVTDDDDFGRPGFEKELDMIVLWSHAASTHDINVYISVDSGANYITVETGVAVYSGNPAIVHKKITGERFRLKVTGAGLYLYQYTMLAFPGPEVKRV